MSMYKMYKMYILYMHNETLQLSIVSVVRLLSSKKLCKCKCVLHVFVCVYVSSVVSAASGL